MEKLIKSITNTCEISFKGKSYEVLTKTWYSIEEDVNTQYIKCELSDNKVLVIIPDDTLIYIGQIIEDMDYLRKDENKLVYQNQEYSKVGEGHQFITRVEFGSIEKVEGKCEFEDFESDNHIISLGILTNKNNIRADVFAEIISLDEISVS